MCARKGLCHDTETKRVGDEDEIIREIHHEV